ncbi:hypothetical protein QNO07_26485 [Streptomyces sp. 549]|uniref:anti-sigma factor family protein n=1 Tax=Streptomyces sp. 549 TaxID=3049076 RepID=UPI0024C28090|nr:hypothetical protein [Streptomyces sp. 549]MDK1476905.1 hypothetical protein [Streptomyces sp. 549]
MTASSATYGTDDHPEVAEISALSEGLLPPERSATVRTHLTDCPLCADVRTSLEEIRDALGTLPGPVRMPEDIAGRIDAALAAEALLEATAPESVEPPETPSAAARVSRETRRPAGTPQRGSAGPGRPHRRPARRRRTTLLAVTGTLAALSLGAVLVPVLLSGAGQETTEQASEPGRSVAESPTGLSVQALEEKVHTLLAQTPENEPPGALPQPETAPEVGAQTNPTAPLRGGSGATGVPYCVREGVNRSETYLAAAPEMYEGTAAYLVVLPHPGDSNRVDVYVVDATCVSEAPSEPGRLISSRTFDRR